MVDVPEVSTTSSSELIAAGRRHLAVKDYHAATEALATACEQLAKEHGELGDECAEAYLWYGQALLGLSREENGVLGDGMPGTNNADEDDEEEGDEENGDEKENGEENAEAEKVEENGEAEKSAEKNGEEKEPVVEKIEAESTTDDAEPGPSEDNVDEEPGTSNGDANDESVVDLDNKDEIENIQLAWEMLDLARNILEKRAEASSTMETKALLADVHLYLGEVALESETYDKAVTDMLTCLEIQKDLYGLDNRRIAETHYQIGLANSLASNFEDAILHFKNAANILETRIKTLESPKAATEDVSVKKYSANDPFYSIEGEVKELKSLLPEIQEKIQDMMDYKAETKRRLAETLCPPLTSSNGSSNGAGSSGASGASSSKPAASDISHLIKRKRKNSEETASPAKKLNA